MKHTAESWLTFILRINGCFAVVAIVAVLMPQSWLVWCVSKVEPGLNVGLLVSYLARALSLYAFLAGLLFLTFAQDVRRYKSPIRVMAVWCIFCIFAFCLYASQNLSYIAKQWFFWFIVGDATYSLVTVLAILVLQTRIDSDPSRSHEANLGPHLDAVAPRMSCTLGQESMKSKHRVSFWFVQVPGWLLLVYLVIAQGVPAFGYELGVRMGTQEPAATITEVGTAFWYGFALGDLLTYIPILLAGLVGHMLARPWGRMLLAAALGITIYWPIVCLVTVVDAREAAGWNLSDETPFWIVLPLIALWGVGGLWVITREIRPSHAGDGPTAVPAE